MEALDSVEELWKDAIWDLLDSGEATTSRDGDVSHEIIGWSGQLLSLEKTFLLNKVRKLNPHYASAELLWYLSGSDDGTRLIPYAPHYTRFLEGDGRAFGAYGARWFYDPAFIQTRTLNADYLGERTVGTQLSAVLNLLTLKPNTRQAVITMYNAGDLVQGLIGKVKDIPCTLALQFLLRDGALHCISYTRSNDAWLGMPNDIYNFTCIQRMVADALKVRHGTYTHHVGSLHLYERFEERARQALDDDTNYNIGHHWQTGPIKISQQQSYAIAAEHLIRTEKDWSKAINFARWLGIVDIELGRQSLLRDTLVLCAQKWHPDFSSNYVRSGRLATACELLKEKT